MNDSMTDSAGPPSASSSSERGAGDATRTRSVVELVRLVRRQAPDEGVRHERVAAHRVQDELMQLPSRRRMQEAIDGALENLRAGCDPSAVLLIDVDAPAGPGETWLGTLSQRLRTTLHPDDLVARFGGDVFVLVAHDIADEAAAHELAAQLKRSLEQPSQAGDASTRMHVSIGVSMVREEDPSVDAVVARADAAMYAARNKASREARGDATCPPESSREELVEAAFERSAIEDFDVYYQPIADLRCGSVAAVEAVMRWEHPDLGTIAPGEFLPLAERLGQMVTLGRSAIEKACAQTIRWAATRDGRPMRTCINVSPSQVVDPAFMEDIESALAHSGATGHQLALELTEEALALMPPGMLEALVDARVELVFDHAGRDVSPSSIANLPVSMIKLDRSFVASATDDMAPQILLEAARLSQSLGLPAVAKGVDTRAQLRSLLLCGVQLAQGRFFARPQSGPAIEALVYRERPFASLLAPPSAMLGTRALEGEAPTVEVGGSPAQ